MKENYKKSYTKKKRQRVHTETDENDRQKILLKNKTELQILIRRKSVTLHFKKIFD